MVAFILPLYPSGQARKALSASQLSRLNESIASSLQSVLGLPIHKADLQSTRAFLASYAKEAAHETLERLVWQATGSVPSTQEKLIRSRSLELAKRLAGLSGGVSLETLTDVSIAYAQKNASRVRDIWSTALSTQPQVLTAVASDLVTSFTSLLDPTTLSRVGLTGTRKAVYCISCVIHATPSDILSAFWKNTAFMTGLAIAYDTGLFALSRMYGGLQHLAGSSQPEEWEITWMESKTAILDSFHVVLRHMLEVISSASPNGGALATESDHAFEVVFAIIEVASTPGRDPAVERIPFYNQSLIADYQHAYDMVKTLNVSLRRADATRMDLLDHQLRGLEASNRQPGDPGALKLLIRSDGMASTVAQNSTIKKQGAVVAVAAVAPPPPSAPSSSQPVSADPQTESQVAQVRELLPDYSETYIRALLIHPDYPFRGNPERVIEALLEGRAPPPDEIEPTVPQSAAILPMPTDSWTYTAERRNVFDEEQVDMSNLRIGKQPEPAGIQQDREAIKRMKADILRRVEAMDEEEAREEVSNSELGIRNDLPRDIAYEDELEEEDHIGVAGDGSAESDVDEDGTDGEADHVEKVSPETVLELAYIRDPKLFERDGQTRRSKARADLKLQTGWADEQIEGWKIMLERMPQAQRDRVLQKHEFKGNRALPSSDSAPNAGESSRGRGGRGRGGRGRGGGGGGRGGGGGDGGDRAWKDRNKASRGNHGRKRGHDKKMARAGAGPSA